VVILHEPECEAAAVAAGLGSGARVTLVLAGRDEPPPRQRADEPRVVYRRASCSERWLSLVTCVVVFLDPGLLCFRDASSEVLAACARSYVAIACPWWPVCDASLRQRLTAFAGRAFATREAPGLPDEVEEWDDAEAFSGGVLLPKLEDGTLYVFDDAARKRSCAQALRRRARSHAYTVAEVFAGAKPPPGAYNLTFCPPLADQHDQRLVLHVLRKRGVSLVRTEALYKNRKVPEKRDVSTFLFSLQPAAASLDLSQVLRAVASQDAGRR
jgi:hypothetical protein